MQLVVPVESRFGATTGDAKLINAIAEKLESGSFRVIKRQGTSYNRTLGTFSPYTIDGPAGQYTVSGGTLLSLVVGHSGPNSHLFSTEGGVLLNDLGVIQGFHQGFFATFSQSGTRIAINDANTVSPGVIKVTDTSGVLVSSPAVSGGVLLVLGIVTLDKTTYAMDINGTVWGSNVGDPTTWSGTNFVSAASEPGAGIYLAKHYDYVVALKEFSTEFLYDNSNPTGSPLSQATNATFLWGCVSAQFVQVFGDRIFWIARIRNGAPFVAMMERLTPGKISTPGIDKLVGDVQPGGGTSGTSFSFTDSFGHSYYGITLFSPGFTLVYDIDQKIWYTWTTSGTSYFQYYNMATDGFGNVIAQSTEPANVQYIYQIDEEFGTDSTAAGTIISIQLDIYTPDQDLNTRQQKSLDRMDFLSDQQPAVLSVRFSEDDFKTWSNFRTVDLNVKRPNLQNCGTFYRRTWNLRHSAPYPFRIEGVEMTMEAGE